jgi:tetratricopeptide (TPR) repeat protein
LIAILSTFAANRSLRELLEDLIHLIDDHTEYFKSHLDALAPTERKVFVALAELWDPSTARDVARAARMDINQTSSLLSRLVGRGAVSMVEETKRRKRYQLAERLYNIYYLMRRRGEAAARVRAVVRFMVTFYEPEELVQRVIEIAREAAQLPAGLREGHFSAYEGILRWIGAGELRERILTATPPTFFSARDIPYSLFRLLAHHPQLRANLPDERQPLASMVEQQEEQRLFFALFLARTLVIRYCTPGSDQTGWLRKILRALSRSPIASDKEELVIAQLYATAEVADLTGRIEEAEAAYRRAIELRPRSRYAYMGLIQCMLSRPGREADALEEARRFGGMAGHSASDFSMLASTLARGTSSECKATAETWAREAVRAEPGVAWHEMVLAMATGNNGKWDEAIEHASLSLADPEWAKLMVSEVIDLGVAIAAAGHARDMLKALEESKSAAIVESLIVGLQLFLGEKVNVAQEILEVGKDVAKRIRERQEALQRPATPPPENTEGKNGV